MTDLRITLVQAPISWEAPAANRARYDRLLAAAPAPTDLIVLPEMCTTGFTMAPAPVAEPPEGPTLDWLRRLAADRAAAVVTSLVVREGERYYNRLYWVRPDGTYATYDKRHLFTMAGEDRQYTAGRERLIVEWRGWRCCPLICYDLRFPVWSRNDGAYDLLLYVANWPRPRAAHWRALLRARAIENQAYVVGLNRIGEDGNGYAYRGDSGVTDPAGEGLTDLGDRETATTVTLSADRLADVRERLPFLRDRDAFTITDPTDG